MREREGESAEKREEGARGRFTWRQTQKDSDGERFRKRSKMRE